MRPTRRLTAFFLAAAVSATAATSATEAHADVRVYTAPADSDKDLSLQSLDLYGWIQPRFTTQQSDTRPQVNFQTNGAFTVRRARFGAIAWLNSWARSQFEVELAGDKAYVVDAFVDAHPIPEIGVTMGQLRVPFSRQNMLPSKNLQFADSAYWLGATVTPGTVTSPDKYIIDRDIGAQLNGELFDKRFRYFLGVYNGDGRGVTQHLETYFLRAIRLEGAPLGAAPKIESDVRSLDDRKKLLANVGASWMQGRNQSLLFDRTWFGMDLAAWWRGASIYAEFYARRDTPIADPTGSQPAPTSTCSAKGLAWAFTNDDDPTKPGGNPANASCVTAVGFNVQAGYFPPVGWLEQHLEVAGRVERFDPLREVPVPTGADNGVRDLSSSNPQWGYLGYVVGVNVFPKKTHDLKVQASYEIRNETKTCLVGQGNGYPGKPCTGAIDNNVLLVQATGAF